jgi:sugar phosphate isomerase/epimerase
MKLPIFAILAFTFVTGVRAEQAKWPLFAFQNGVHFKSVEERVSALKELGYDGIGSANPSTGEQLKKRLSLYDEAKLKLFSFYVGGRLGAKGHTYNPVITEMIAGLKGRDTVIELYVQGSKKDNTDEQAVAFVREIADQAKQSGLKVVLYPHANFYIDRIGDAVRVAKKTGRDNVGVMFNLCHFLHVEPKTDLKAALENAKPLLWRASISGAEQGGRSWGQLIQTLDRGSFDQSSVLELLRGVGFDGVIGLQCYAIRGDSRENLKRSMAAWRKLQTP